MLERELSLTSYEGMRRLIPLVTLRVTCRSQLRNIKTCALPLETRKDRRACALPLETCEDRRACALPLEGDWLLSPSLEFGEIFLGFQCLPQSFECTRPI